LIIFRAVAIYGCVDFKFYLKKVDAIINLHTCLRGIKSRNLNFLAFSDLFLEQQIKFGFRLTFSGLKSQPVFTPLSNSYPSLHKARANFSIGEESATLALLNESSIFGKTTTRV